MPSSPAWRLEAGDTVAFDTRDAADGLLLEGLPPMPTCFGRGPFRGHPLTGPVRVRGAAPGDTLVVEVAGDGARRRPSAGRRSARGAACCRRRISQVRTSRSGTSTECLRRGARHRRATRLFPGVMGAALDKRAGTAHPPRKNGGNMDIKQLTAGTTLYLPVRVDGALFPSATATPPGRRRGVPHRHRDDGRRDAPLRPARGGNHSGAPVPHRPRPGGHERRPVFVTTAHGPDLLAIPRRPSAT